MTEPEALRILKLHQQWRLGADIPPTSPYDLTSALEIAINLMEARSSAETRQQGVRAK